MFTRELDKLLQQARPLLLPATIGGSIRYGDWDDPDVKGSPVGFLKEVLRSLSGINTWPFFVWMDRGWTKQDIVNLLAYYGIASWGWGVSSRSEYFFRVKKRQAHWAQYVMLRAGVPVTRRLLAGSRAGMGSNNFLRRRCEHGGIGQSGIALAEEEAVPEKNVDSSYACWLDDSVINFADRLGG